MRFPCRSFTSNQLQSIASTITNAGLVPLAILTSQNQTNALAQINALKDIVTYYEYGNEDNYSHGWSGAIYASHWSNDIPVLKAAAPNAKFGGPVGSDYTDTGSTYLTNFLNGIKGNSSLTPDFISMHYYSGHGEIPAWTSTQILNDVTNDMLPGIDTMKSDISSIMSSSINLAITEWNYDAVPENNTNILDADATFMHNYTFAVLNGFQSKGVWAACQYDFAAGAGGGHLDMVSTSGTAKSQYNEFVNWKNQSTNPAPPSITTQPQNQAINVGSSATFNVTATGSAPLNYQWWFNGTNLLAGATNSSLTLTNVQMDDAGNYSMVVTNTAGSVTSSNAVLTVNTSNVPITVYDFNNGLPAGTVFRSGTLVMGVTNAGGFNNSGCMVLTRPIPSTQIYGQWCITNDLANGAAVSNFNVSFKLYMGNGSGGNAPVPHPGGNGLIFHVGPTPPNQYTGGASSWGNGLDVTFRTYNSSPNAPGVNIEYNASTNTKSPGSGTIIATSSFIGYLQTNGASDNFSGAVDVSVTLSNGVLNVVCSNALIGNRVVYTNLTIPGFAPISPGTLAFTATSGASAIEDAWIDNVSIAVNTGAGPGNVPPLITTQPQNQSVSAGQTATFSVTVTNTASPPISHQWWKIVPGISTNSISPATNASYTTPALSLADNGEQYYATVSNAVSLATSSTATLTVTGQPTFGSVMVNGGNLTLTWSNGSALLMATNMALPMAQWTVVTGATSPHVITNLNAPQQFYRMKQ
jgi:hypothetical protein